MTGRQGQVQKADRTDRFGTMKHPYLSRDLQMRIIRAFLCYFHKSQCPAKQTRVIRLERPGECHIESSKALRFSDCYGGRATCTRLALEYMMSDCSVPDITVSEFDRTAFSLPLQGLGQGLDPLTAPVSAVLTMLSA